MNTFTAKNPKEPCVLDAREVPVYDVFADAAGDRVWWIGPAYARKAFLVPHICLDGIEVGWQIVDDPYHCTFQAFSRIPPALRGRPTITAEIKNFGNAVYRSAVSLREERPAGRLAIQTLAKFDWPYVAEWIEHHQTLGVEHFFIYNNGEAKLSATIAPYADAGLVTELQWPWGYVVYPTTEWFPWWPNDSHLYAQPPAIMHWIRKYGQNWSWVWCGDCDEFLNATAPVLPTLDSFSGSGWSLEGRWFGNAGLRECPSSLRSSYVRCEEGMTSAKKLILRPADVEAFEIHRCQCEAAIRAMPPEQLHFHHYRAASDHHARRTEEFDGEFTNESEDRSLCPAPTESR